MAEIDVPKEVIKEFEDELKRQIDDLKKEIIADIIKDHLNLKKKANVN